MAFCKTKIPRHIAIIMDGNGRWARNQGKERIYGHANGVESVRKVVSTSTKLGVEYLTIYAFSTENWGRPANEVDALMQLMAQTIAKEARSLYENGVKLKFIGDIKSMPAELRESIAHAEQVVPDKVNMTLIIALNYSSRREIASAMKKIAKKVTEGTLKTAQIDEKLISSYLETHEIPDPELLIRTSGEQRLSNFLLWQLSYSELYFTPVMWPDFGQDDLMEAIEEYQRRERRFGLI